MKIYSSNVQQLMELDNLSPYFLVTIELKGGTVFHTNTPMDVTVPALGTFSADNDLLSIEAPKLSAVVDRETYKITYADNSFVFRELFHQGIVGTPVTVYIGFYNTTDFELGGALPGNPLSNYEDLIIAYKGFIDSHGHTIDVEDSNTAVLECSSPMASLDLTKPFYTSRDSMRQVNPDDSSFDDVYNGSKAISLVWGKR